MQLVTNSTGSRARSANSGPGARGRMIQKLCVCVCQDCSEKEKTLGCLGRCFIPHSLSLALLHVPVCLLSSSCTAPGFDQSWQAASKMLCRVSSPQCPSLSSRPNLQISLSPPYDAFAVWWVVWYHVPGPAVTHVARWWQLDHVAFVYQLSGLYSYDSRVVGKHMSRIKLKKDRQRLKSSYITWQVYQN